ncbi:MAG: hypothetical protein ACJAS1_006413 [Oleiphilaceae bacterium]|jgi:hypothetical protein
MGKKYYSLITSLEQKQSYDELLQRSLGRLALATQGLDLGLDKQLKSLWDEYYKANKINKKLRN